jgi:hypothetical protein
LDWLHGAPEDLDVLHGAGAAEREGDHVVVLDLEARSAFDAGPTVTLFLTSRSIRRQS